MGKTVIEKIVEHNTGRSVKPGDIVTVNVDRGMIHDIFIPFVAEKFKEMGFEKLLADCIARHTGVTPKVSLISAVSEAEQHQMEEKLARKIAPPED